MPTQLITNNVQGRMVPGYAPANDPTSWGSRLAGIFDGTAKVVGNIMERRDAGNLQSAQADKLRAETDVIQRQREGYKLYGETLAQVFQNGGAISDAMQALSPIVSQYNLDPVATLKSTASVIAAMPDSDSRKSQALEVLNNFYPIYSNQNFGVGETATGPDAKRVFDATQQTARRGQDVQAATQRYVADRNLEAANVRADATVDAANARAAGKVPADTLPKITAQTIEKARKFKTGAVAAAIGLNMGTDEKSAKAFYAEPANAALVRSPEFQEATRVAEQLILDGMPTGEAGFQAAARVLNGRKWNAKTRTWEVDPEKAKQYGTDNVGFNTLQGVPIARGLANSFMPSGDLVAQHPGRIDGSSPGDDSQPMDNIGGLPRVTNAAEYSRLKPGQKFVDDEGNVRTKRAQ